MRKVLDSKWIDRAMATVAIGFFGGSAVCACVGLIWSMIQYG